jgi:hypothetical protein
LQKAAISGSWEVDVGNVDKEGFTIGCLDGHIDPEVLAVAGASPQEVL